jgi:hypothetical protein
MSILKVCKGTGKAKGEGCGQDLQYSERGGMKVYFSKFGLGTSGCRCFYNWFEIPEPIKKVSNKRNRKIKSKQNCLKKFNGLKYKNIREKYHSQIKYKQNKSSKNS